MNGTNLVADYLAAVTNVVTANTAQFEAEISEQTTMNTLNRIGHQNPIYLTPGDIPPEEKDRLIKSSFDAHLKKAQSEQINTAVWQQVTTLEVAARRRYRGMRATISSLTRNFRPFEAVWYDSRNGRYDTRAINVSQVKGYIDDIMLSQNVLVIRPSLTSRTFWPSRKFYLIQVVNPKSLGPAVDINLSSF